MAIKKVSKIRFIPPDVFKLKNKVYQHLIQIGVDFKEDSQGWPIKEGEMVVSFPSLTEAEIAQLLKNHFDLEGIVTVKKCKCDPTLQSWIWPSHVELLAEANRGSSIKTSDAEVARDRLEERVKQEGSFFLNYYAYDVLDSIREPNVPSPPTQKIPVKRKIAILDSGLKEDFSIRIDPLLWTSSTGKSQDCFPGGYKGRNFVDYDKAPLHESESSSHGTAVTATFVNALKKYNNGNLPADIEIMNFKVLEDNGAGSLFDVMCGISTAIKYGADVINMSFGFYGEEIARFFNHLRPSLDVPKMPIMVTSKGNLSRNTDLHEIRHYPSDWGYRGDMAHLFPAASNNGAIPESNIEIWHVPLSQAGSNYSGIHSTISAPGVDGTSFGAADLSAFIISLLRNQSLDAKSLRKFIRTKATYRIEEEMYPSGCLGVIMKMLKMPCGKFVHLPIIQDPKVLAKLLKW